MPPNPYKKAGQQEAPLHGPDKERRQEQVAWHGLCSPSSPAASCSGLLDFRPFLDMAPVNHMACARCHPHAKPGPVPAQVIKTTGRGTFGCLHRQL